jgi:hypothetical protein
VRLVILAAAAGILAASPAPAVELRLGEQTIDIPLLRNHCVLTETGANDARFAEFVGALQSSHLRVLLITVHCEQLDRYRETAGWFWRVDEFVAYVTPRLDNRASYIGMTQADYAAERAQQVRLEFPVEQTNEVERWSSQLKRNAGFRAATEGKNVLEHDATAAYVGTFVKVSDGRGVKRYFAVSGETLVLGRPVAVVVFRSADNQKARKAMRQQAKTAVADLVAAERRLTGAPDDPPQPWLIAAAAGALIAVSVLLGGLLFLRAR